MKEKKGFRIGLNVLLILMVLVPVLIGSTIISLMSIFQIESNLEEETKNELAVAANGLKGYYEYDIAAGLGLTYEHDYVDSFQNQEIEMTVFENDIRLMTSIKDASGNRIEGTPASAEIWSKVKGGSDYFSADVKINNKDYYVYYMPMKDEAGNVLGMAFAGKTCENVNVAINAAMTSALWVEGILVVVFAGLGILVARIVSKPIKGVSESIERIAEGDLSDKDAVHSIVKETALLARAQNLLQEKLSAVIDETRQTSDNLISTIEEVSDDSSRASGDANQINSAMEDLAQGATAMASAVQDISSEVAEIDMCVGDMVDSVKQLNDASDAMKSANAEATQFMDKVAEASDSSVEAVAKITGQIEATNQAIDKIDEAVTAIMGIASQTNLLALNASIEAARAGEAGRGFAVVADEINNLSMQSNESAKEISGIVNEIKAQSRASVELAGKVRDIIEKEQAYVEDTNAKFAVLNAQIQVSVDNIQNISSKVETLDEVKNRISSNVEDLSAVSEENAASNEEVSASLSNITEAINGISEGGSNMTQGALELQDAIAYFRR